MMNNTYLLDYLRQQLGVFYWALDDKTHIIHERSAFKKSKGVDRARLNSENAS